MTKLIRQSYMPDRLQDAIRRVLFALLPNMDEDDMNDLIDRLTDACMEAITI